MSYAVEQSTFPLAGGLAVAEAVPIGPGRAPFSAALATFGETVPDAYIDALLLVHRNSPLIETTREETAGGGTRDYFGESIGTNARGDAIYRSFDGFEMFRGGFSAFNAMEINGDLGFVSYGTTVTGTPPAKADYYGYSLLLGGRRLVVETGDFMMFAQFERGRASIEIQGETLQLSGGDLQISGSTHRVWGNGEFHDNIGPIRKAKILGYFAGDDAAGVHGVAAQVSDSPTAMRAMFVGLR